MRGRDRHPQKVATFLILPLLLLVGMAPSSAGSAYFDPYLARPAAVSVVSPEIPSLPDLIVSQIAVVPAMPSVGRSVRIQVTIKNQGDYDVPLENDFRSDLYVDPAVVPIGLGQDGVHEWPCTPTSLPAGGSHVLEMEYIFDEARTVSLFAQTDTSDQVLEADENNNAYGPVLIQVEPASRDLLITAVYHDTYLTDEPDEAFRLMNVSEAAVDLTNWAVTDIEGTITLSDTLAAGASIWIASEADGFTLEFGFPPDYEYGADTDHAVPDLITTGTFALANTGDQVILKDDGGVIVDSVVYEGGDPTDTGWSGPGIYPYGGDTVGIERFAQEEQGVEAFGKEGQVLYRKLDQATGLPVPADRAL